VLFRSLSPTLALRADAPAVPAVDLTGALVRDGLALTLSAHTALPRSPRSLGPLRSWTEGRFTAGVARLAPGPLLGVELGASVRSWRDPLGPVATTWLPTAVARVGWAVPVAPRLALAASGFLQLDAGSTPLSVDGRDRGAIGPVCGGFSLGLLLLPDADPKIE